ncbi:MAG: CPBP family intramembrane glutamic endopeptidase [bacterium JZ-2024 1]
MRRLHPFDGVFLFVIVIGIYGLLVGFMEKLTVEEGLLISHVGIFFLLPFLYVILRGVSLRETFLIIWPGVRGIFGGLFGGLGALFLGSALLELILRHFFSVPEEFLRKMVEIIKGEGMSRSIIMFALFPAVFEEWFFRGFLFQAFRWRLGVNFSAVLTAVLFGLSHIYSLGDYIRSITTAWLGFVLALLVVRFQSLIPAMVGHFLVNFFIILTVFHYPSLSGIEGYTGGTAWGLLFSGTFCLLLAFYVFAPRQKG